MLLVLLLHCCQSLRHPVPKEVENGLHRVRVPVNRQRHGLEPGAAFLPACMLTVSYFLPTAPHKQQTARSMSSLQPRRLLQLKYQGYSSPVPLLCTAQSVISTCSCKTADLAARQLAMLAEVALRRLVGGCRHRAPPKCSLGDISCLLGQARTWSPMSTAAWYVWIHIDQACSFRIDTRIPPARHNLPPPCAVPACMTDPSSQPCILLGLQGLAHCFMKADGGGLTDVMVIEPISSASLECMATGGTRCALTMSCSALRQCMLLVYGSGLHKQGTPYKLQTLATLGRHPTLSCFTLYLKA